MSASRLPTPASRYGLLPSSWLPSRLIVQEQDHRPDLPLGEKVLPARHRRVPRRALARQAGTAFRDTPEHEALGELRDRAVVLEVRRDRIEPRGVVPLAIQVVAVAGQAVLVVDPLAVRRIGGAGLRVLPQRIVEARERDRLPAERDLAGRGGVDRA